MNNEKINSKLKLSNNSSFIILIFVILKFRNIVRSFDPHPFEDKKKIFYHLEN